MKGLVREAFMDVHDGYSADRVIADPELNAAFIAACRRRGLEASERDLNQCLLNLRKSSQLKGLPRSRRTSFENDEEYYFASEIAARYLERHERVTLDQILCDPDLIRRFDVKAAELAPGYSVLQYRWAAFGLRKSKRLGPERMAHLAPSEWVDLHSVALLDLKTIPTCQGLYVFYDAESRQALYIGESENLRNRLEKHLDHSDNKCLARWLWENGTTNLFLEIHILAAGTTKPARRALEAELIASRKPMFNIDRPQAEAASGWF